jgi:hypothetical protein
MELVGERTVPPRPPAMVSLPEQSVESFHLTEEELATPVQGRIRRRSFSRLPAEPGPDAGASGPGGEPQGGRPARPPRPEKRAKPEKRPLSELDHFGEPRTPREEMPQHLPDVAPPPATPDDEGFGAGLDDSASQ